MNSPANEQQEGKAEHLQDMIADEFDRMESEEEEEHEEVEVSEEEVEETHEAVDEEPEDEVEESEEAEEAEQQLQEEIEEAAESDYNEPAPERWPEEIKEVYNGLPPVARKAMLDGIYKPMQRSYTQSTQELARMKQRVGPMLEALDQHRNDFERMGVNPEEAFRTQMAWASHLAKVGPEQGIKDMQAAYGLDAQPAGQQTPNEYLTPAERAMKAQIDSLQQHVLNQQQQQQQQTQEQAEAQRQEAYKQEIQRNLHEFVNEKTDDGKPAHPHVERVANGIAGVIRGGMVKQVDDYGNPRSMRDQIAQAYQMACNLDPTIRTAAPQQRQVNRARAAQKVGVATKQPAGHQPEVDDSSMHDFIEKQFDILSRRAS